MASVDEVLRKALDPIDMKEVFGEPVERNGVTIIPVAKVVSGGGGGGDAGGEAGSGAGYGFRAVPVGAFIISGDQVRFEPVINVNKIVAGSFAVAIVGIVWAPRIIKQARKLLKGR